MPQRRSTPTRQKRRALARIEDKANDRARTIAEFIAFWANREAPVDDNRHRSHKNTRRLKGSYYVMPAKNRDGWVVASAVDYWAFVEYGTGHFNAPHNKGGASPGFPHVRKAIQRARAVYGR